LSLPRGFFWNLAFQQVSWSALQPVSVSDAIFWTFRKHHPLEELLLKPGGNDGKFSKHECTGEGASHGITGLS
jgi:hypothetical protein